MKRFRRWAAHPFWWLGNKVSGPCRPVDGENVRDWELNIWYRGTQAAAQDFWLEWQDAACTPDGCAAQGGSMCPIEDDEE